MKDIINQYTGLPKGMYIQLCMSESRAPYIQVSFRRKVSGEYTTIFTASAASSNSLWRCIKEILDKVIIYYKEQNIVFPRLETIRIIAEKEIILKQYQKIINAVVIERKKRFRLTGRTGRILN